jgi:hypothetical protein
MKIVLQNKSDSSYIATRGGAWTKDSERAHEFADSLEALFYCFNRRMKNMQMVARFADSKMNFSVTVTDVRAP